MLSSPVLSEYVEAGAAIEFDREAGMKTVTTPLEVGAAIVGANYVPPVTNPTPQTIFWLVPAVKG